MAKGWMLPVVAVSGILFAAAVSVRTERAPEPAQPVRWPPEPPFLSFIAGAGIVEARDGNIIVGAPIPGIVTTVAVDTGSPIKQGDLLFTVDDRPYVANQNTAQASLEQAIANLDKLIAAPRPQERQIAQAELEQARAQAEQARARLKRIQSLVDPMAVSATDREAALFGAQAYSAQEKGAALRFDIAQEGTWEKELAITRAAVRVAEAQLARAVVDVAYTRVTSPIDGMVLFKGMDPGNYVGGPTGMVIGQTQILRVRVDIDEVDAWRFHPEAPAFAFLRGNSTVRIPLKFDKYESLVQPKRSLTLANDERIDTRVLQVLYTFEPKTLPVALYVGQLLDVFIEAIPVGTVMKPEALPAGLERLNNGHSSSSHSSNSHSSSSGEGKPSQPAMSAPAPRLMPPRRAPQRGDPLQPPRLAQSQTASSPALGLHVGPQDLLLQTVEWMLSASWKGTALEPASHSHVAGPIPGDRTGASSPQQPLLKALALSAVSNELPKEPASLLVQALGDNLATESLDALFGSIPKQRLQLPGFP